MNSVIEKLAEVEETAEAIVEHARQQKSEIEKQIQEERNQFDRDLEEETQKKLEKIKEKCLQYYRKIQCSSDHEVPGYGQRGFQPVQSQF